MIQHISKWLISIISCIFILQFAACKGNNNETEEATQNHDHKNESTTENTTTFTPEQIKNAGVVYGDLEERHLDGTLTVNGKLRVPNNSKANATSLFGGVIKTLNVELGDYVKKGQIIATIANPEFIQLQEEYVSIASSIVFAQQEYDRQKDMNDGDVGAKRNLQKATAELKALQSRQASLYQQIKMMGIQPSTISGTVSDVFAKIGSYVDVSSPVIEIIDNNSIHLDLQVFEKDLSLIEIGQEINFTITNNPTIHYSAAVYNISSSFNDDSKAIAVHGNIIGNKKGLIDGMNIVGQVVLKGMPTSVVPNDAIVNHEGKDYIFIVEAASSPTNHNHEDGHDHDHSNEAHTHTNTNSITFKRIEIIKGISNLGYTGFTTLTTLPKQVQIVKKGSFFINAKMNDTGDHGHAH